jgi:hypothetical protein
VAVQIVRIEVDKDGNHISTELLRPVFESIPDAETEAQQIAQSFHRRGEDRENGYWWYEDQGRRYRLIVNG